MKRASTSFATGAISITFLIFAVVALFRSSLYHSSLIVGNDFFWHLEYGKYFLSHHALPEGDWLTWTSANQPYEITQWLGELLLSIPVHWGGSQFLSITVAAIGCLTLFFSWRTAAIFLENSVLALCVALFTLLPVLTLNARPQLFGFTAFAALVWVMAEWFAGKKRWALFAMPTIMVFWVNAHGSFIVGVAYIAALGGGAWLSTFAEMRWRFLDSVRVHLPLAIASFGALFAALINPYGWRVFESVLMISNLQTTRSGVISEWLATSMTTMHGEIFFSIFFCVLFALAMAKNRPDGKTILGFIGTAYFGLSADRQTFFALIAMVPFFALALKGSALEELFNKKCKTYAKPLQAVLVLAVGSVLAWLVHYSAEKHIQNSFTELYPVKAMAFLEKNNITGKLFNKVEYGGYIESLGEKAFIDGRLDLFGDEMVLGTMNALAGKPGWDLFLAKYNPEIFILDNSDPLKELLQLKSACKPIYSDNFHAVIQCPFLPGTNTLAVRNE